MTPSPLMLWTVALVGIPALLVRALTPAFAPLAVGVVVLLVVWAVFDAFVSRRSLQHIKAALPDVVRLTKCRAGEVDMLFDNPSTRARDVRIALALPRELSSPYESMRTRLAAGPAQTKVSWECTPSKRGNFALHNVYIEALSLLGAWTLRSTLPAESEVRVYPDLRRDRRSLAALFLNRGAFGVHAQRQVGQGREFEKLREYAPGDSFMDIHWKATAKRGHPVTKLYQVERTQEVYVIIDASRLAARTVVFDDAVSPDDRVVTQLERFVSAALVLGLAAERQGDLFGLLTFSDGIHRFLRARTGKGHFDACRDALYALEPRIVAPDFSEMASFIRTRLRRRALLLILTNLDDPVLAEQFVQSCALFERHHLVLVNMLTPPKVGPIFSGEEPANADDIYEQLAGHLIWRDLKQVKQTLHRQGVPFGMLSHASLAADLVSQYVGVKQRQLL
jgi:uncharacterized protein (DUF58 family)